MTFLIFNFKLNCKYKYSYFQDNLGDGNNFWAVLSERRALGPGIEILVFLIIEIYTHA